MSAVIELSMLKEEHLVKIKDLLVITVEPKWIPCRDPVRASFINRNRGKEYINMFIIDKEKMTISLPYTFACKLLGRRFNMDINHCITSITTNIILREDQEKIAIPAYNDLIEKGCVMLHADTGTGKTLTSIYMTAKLNTMILVMHTNDVLTDQWVKSYEKFTDAKIMYIYKRKIYYTYEYLVDNVFVYPDVIITICSQIKNLPRYILDRVGCIIIDELHLMCTKEKVEPLLATHPKYIVACSATPYREDNKTLMVVSMIGNNIHTMKNKKNMIVVKVLTGVVPMTTEGEKINNMEWDAVVKSLYRSEKRNSIIMDIVINNYKQNKIIMGVSRVNYVVSFSESLNRNGINSEYLKQGKSTYVDSEQLVLIGTPQKIGVGFDEAMNSIDYSGVKSNMLVLTFPINNHDLLIQFIGRIRDDNPIIFHLIDEGRVFEKQWSECMKVYSSIGAKIQICDLRQIDEPVVEDFAENFAKNLKIII